MTRKRCSVEDRTSNGEANKKPSAQLHRPHYSILSFHTLPFRLCYSSSILSFHPFCFPPPTPEILSTPPFTQSRSLFQRPHLFQNAHGPGPFLFCNHSKISYITYNYCSQVVLTSTPNPPPLVCSLYLLLPSTLLKFKGKKVRRVTITGQVLTNYVI